LILAVIPSGRGPRRAVCAVGWARGTPIANRDFKSIELIRPGILKMERNIGRAQSQKQRRKHKAVTSSIYWYLLASLSGTLYAGLTDNLWKRVQEHKAGLFDGFTRKHKVNRLMYYETFRDSTMAAHRELQIKKWRREKKIALFAKSNLQWKDLTPEIPQIIGFPRPRRLGLGIAQKA
jgi:putative endonuclease